MSDITIVHSTVGGNPNGIPLGTLMITASLEENGYTVDFRDYQTYEAEKKPLPSTFLDFIRSSTDLLGIGCMCGSIPYVLGAIQKLREEKPGKTVILGGPSATDTPLEIMEHFPVDIIVVGEGEETIVDLMHALEGEKEFSDVPGIIYRDNGEIKVNPRRERIKDLDSVPFPAYHKIDFRDYGFRAGLVTTRGCPYRCTFCSAHSVWGYYVTKRSIQRVVQEIEMVKDKAKSMGFVDDTLVLSRKRLFELCDYLRNEHIDLPWECHARINHMDEEMLKRMGSSYCTELLYGIESGSNRILERVKKGFTIEEARTVVEKTLKHIPTVYTSYIWGYPFETMEDFYDTIMAVYQDFRLPHVTPNLYLLCPYPRSQLAIEYFDKLQFSEELSPGIGGLPTWEDLQDYPVLVDTIRRYPSIFSSFYYIDHDSLPKKRKVIEKIIAREEKVLLQRARSLVTNKLEEREAYCDSRIQKGGD